MANILVVDDEQGIREFLVDALTLDGHEVAQAADGMEALRRAHDRAFDLMLTDLKMPGALTGIDILRKLKSEQPETEVIVMTAHGSVESAVEAMKLGAYDYLQKPIGSPAEAAFSWLALSSDGACGRRTKFAGNETSFRPSRTATR